MARRSARLQKRSPTPVQSDSSNSTWETAPHEQSPAQQEQLADVEEVDEPTMKTPQKPAAAANASQASQTQPSTATPTRTPQNRTPIKPTGLEMHPAHHHQTTAKVLDEARWLGFQALGAHTAPPKPMGLSAGQDTPTKTPAPATPGKAARAGPGSPDFSFRFRLKSPLNGALSPASSRILKDAAQETVAEGRGLFKATEFTAPDDVTPKRKTVVPKGKIARFSDAHMKEFKKMDSIANHPSVFRADPNRFKNALQKSSSKVDLTQAESGAKAPNKLKRTQSKVDLTESPPKAPVSALKRTRSKADITESTTKIVPTPLKRTKSKIGMPGGSAKQSDSSVPVVPPSRDDPKEDNPIAKRIKRTETDDAATTRPKSREDKSQASKPLAAAATPARKNMALPRLASRLMTPTKSSIARSQSVKALKSQSMIPGPSLLRSPSTKNLYSPTSASTLSAKNLFSPTNIGNAVKEGVRDGIRKTSSSLQRVRSILRTPSRKFSEDPEKVAAGTHMSPPSGWNVNEALPAVPQTAPVKKHVNFTNSTLERATWDELGKSPSPMKLRAGSEIPAGAVIYPTLGNTVEYPTIAGEDAGSTSASPSRRLTFGGATDNTSSAFSFKSDKSINFGPSSTGTIRMVRKSDAWSVAEGKKRKLNTVVEGSDKENSEPPQDEGRSPKKIKTALAEVPKTPSKTASKLPRRTPRGSSISKSRLAFLATPKRGKA